MSPYYSSKVYFDELVLKDIILSPNKEFHKNQYMLVIIKVYSLHILQRHDPQSLQCLN